MELFFCISTQKALCARTVLSVNIDNVKITNTFFILLKIIG